MFSMLGAIGFALGIPLIAGLLVGLVAGCRLAEARAKMISEEAVDEVYLFTGVRDNQIKSCVSFVSVSRLGAVAKMDGLPIFLLPGGATTNPAIFWKPLTRGLYEMVPEFECAPVDDLLKIDFKKSSNC